MKMTTKLMTNELGEEEEEIVVVPTQITKGGLC